MDKPALLIIDAQQEYFAPIGKVVLPDGLPAVARIAHPAVTPAPGEPIITKHLPGAFTNTPLEAELRSRGIERVTAAMDVKAPDGAVIPHDQVHRTHPGSLNGFLAEVKRSDEVIRP